MGSFVLKTASDGQTYFNLKAGNGETILSSEMYKAKASALNGIESVKTNAPIDERYERKVSTNGKHFFVLKAGNHEVIGKSEMYESESSRDHGIQSVKNNAPGADVKDETAG
ncbi:MAG: YegP family protein [Phycisphaerales bacterium]